MKESKPSAETGRTALPETDNLQFASDQDWADQLNADFYGTIQYPWPPWVIERFARRNLWCRMLSQDLGYYERSILPQKPRIWVAGCGTNQALLTALKFPDADVLGSDLSRESLDVCAGNARQLGAGNLELRNESINKSAYRQEFDYVICTGVLHHNARPGKSMRKLARAVKPNGILEVAVYNRFHRIHTSAFQLAVRLLADSSAEPDLNREAPIARRLIETFQSGDRELAKLLELQKSASKAEMMDALLQPIEHSYTVESFQAMAEKSGLELLVFSVDQFSLMSGNCEWNLAFEDEWLRERYNSLPDSRRWQVTNLLQASKSPMLWFYLQPQGSANQRRSEQQICHRFLDCRFTRLKTEKTIYSRTNQGRYDKRPQPAPFPGTPKGPVSKRVYENLDERAPLQRTLDRLGIETSFPFINRLRISLATSAFPFLESKHD